MTIKVTKKHIREGKRGFCRQCPVALALMNATNYKRVFVSSYSWQLGSGKQSGTLPQRAQNFIEDFDGGKNVKPFSFDLDVVAR